MHHECPKYPKNLINDQNIPKPSKMTTLPPSPPPPKKNFSNDQNTIETTQKTKTKYPQKL